MPTKKKTATTAGTKTATRKAAGKTAAGKTAAGKAAGKTATRKAAGKTAAGKGRKPKIPGTASELETLEDRRAAANAYVAAEKQGRAEKENGKAYSIAYTGPLSVPQIRLLAAIAAEAPVPVTPTHAATVGKVHATFAGKYCGKASPAVDRQCGGVTGTVSLAARGLVRIEVSAVAGSRIAYVATPAGIACAEALADGRLSPADFAGKDCREL